VITKNELKRNTLKIAVGDSLSLDFIHDLLHEYKFNRVDFVIEPGDFAIRGGIIDVFSYSNDQPYRIEFFGDEIDSIRTFDIESQLSIDRMNKVDIMPNVENKFLEEKRQSFLKYIPSKTVIFTKNPDLAKIQLDKLFEKAQEAFKNLTGEIKQMNPEELFCKGTLISRQLQDFPLVKIVNGKNDKGQNIISFNTLPQPSFNKQFDLLIADLQENTDAGITNYLYCDNENQAKRFHDIFDDLDQQVEYQTITNPLYQGFLDHDLKIACFTDHQIFERYHKFRLKSGYSKKQSLQLKELNNLVVGDYVTHIDHGICKFGGLQKIDVEGKKQQGQGQAYCFRSD